MRAAITGMQQMSTETTATETDKPAILEQLWWRAWLGVGSTGRLFFSGPPPPLAVS